LLEGVKRTQSAYYLPPELERVNVAWAFNEHFPQIEKEVVQWNELLETLAASENALRDWVDTQLSAIGISGGPTASFLAKEAQSVEPRFDVDEAAGEIRVGSKDLFVLSLAGMEDRPGKQAALREIFDRATKQPERARIDLTRAQMRGA
jgi:hypothetical protein